MSSPLPALLPFLHTGEVFSFCPGTTCLRNYQYPENLFFLSVASCGIFPTLSLELLHFLKPIASILLFLPVSFCDSWHPGCFAVVKLYSLLFPPWFFGLTIVTACILLSVLEMQREVTVRRSSTLFTCLVFLVVQWLLNGTCCLLHVEILQWPFFESWEWPAKSCSWHLIPIPASPGVYVWTLKAWMKKVKITSPSICCWWAVQRAKFEPSSNSPFWTPKEKRQKQWVCKNSFSLLGSVVCLLLFDQASRSAGVWSTVSFLQRASERIDLYKARTGDSKNLLEETFFWMRPMDFFQMTNSLSSVR